VTLRSAVGFWNGWPEESLSRSLQDAVDDATMPSEMMSAVVPAGAAPPLVESSTRAGRESSRRPGNPLPSAYDRLCYVLPV
jgi:hypothetical protein